MNILVPYSWLKDFLKTEAGPQKTAEVLSLCSQSVEKISQKKGDSILEIEITVNRYDCLSIIGIAREAAAALNQLGIQAQFKPPLIPTLPKIEKPRAHLEVEFRDKTICPRFSAIVIDQIKIKPSPKWLSERLEKVGIRSLSNVVDISNYLMIETGQPIHTFDYDKILGQKMIMRLSKPGEKVITLDSVTRTLPGGDIVIEDGEGRLIDLCGIMGAENSQIDEKTERVLFFVQAYNPVRIRRTSMSLGHRTEAAVRFERGIDLEGIIPVLAQGAKMMKDLSGGEIASQLIDIYSQPQEKRTIELELNHLNKIIGIEIPKEEVISILKSLGFSVLSIKSSVLGCLVPSWRANDVFIEEDLIEEVARIYGYHRLPSHLPPLNPQFGLTATPKPLKGKIEPFFRWENKIKDLLVNQGFFEVYHYSFISQEMIEKAGLEVEKSLKIKNPLTSDLEYLRPSLMPSLLKTAAKNQALFPQMKIFELADVYLPQAKNLPEEKARLVCLVTEKDFFYLKGVAEFLLKQLGIKNFSFKPWVGREPYFMTESAAVIETKKNLLGTIGEINSQVSARFGLSNKVVVLDLNFESLTQLATNKKTYQPLSKYPAIIEDLTLILKPKTPVGELIEVIKDVTPLIQGVELIDSFKNSQTFRITYQNPKKTLTDKEVEKLRGKVIKKIEQKFGAKLKST
jgi:phenylalanyl-tRNA synthetase beta chain